MIKELFFPERIGTKRFLSQKILAIDTHGDSVYAVLVYAKKSGSIVERLYHERLEPGKEQDYDARLIKSLKKLISQIKHYDQVRVSMPTAAVFKELEVPFVDHDKIRMVLDYEIESMLPFALEEAIIDFIVTEKLSDKKSSKIFVAAVRMQDIQKTLDLYAQAGIEPSSITLDLFALYSLYQQIPEYKNLEHGSALVDLGETTTQVSFIHEGKLRLTRSVQKGLLTVANNISKEADIPVEEVLMKLKTIGIKKTGNAEYDKVVEKFTINFFNDIQFTLNSFSLKLNFYKGVSKILFAGRAAEINDMARFTNDLLQVPCEIFEPQKLFANPSIKDKIVRAHSSLSNYAIALGTAIPSNEQIDFDLRRKSFVLDRTLLIKKQLIAGFVLMIALFAFLGIKGYMQVSDLAKKAAVLEKQEARKILSPLPRKERPKGFKIASIKKKAETILKKKEAIWGPFTKDRIKFLEILLEITKIMDKRLFNLAMSEFSIEEKEIGKPQILIEGFLKAQQGDEHFKDYSKFLKRFDDSVLLKKVEESGLPTPDKGVNFTIKLERKEE